MSALDFSENEDDPDVYESSGSEWDSSHEVETKRKSSRRISARRKVGKLRSSSSSDSEEAPKARRKNGVNKRQKIESTTTPTTKTTSEKSPKTPYSRDYATGAFLVAKKDAQVGDRSKPPCIWRVDGKALLQKFEPFTDESGKVRHRTTSVYTGWSALDRDLYAPITVSVTSSNPVLIVDVNWDKLKEINFDSD